MEASTFQHTTDPLPITSHNLSHYSSRPAPQYDEMIFSPIGNRMIPQSQPVQVYETDSTFGTEFSASNTNFVSRDSFEI